MLTRFLVLILGALTPAPRILEPVVNIPLKWQGQWISSQIRCLLRKRVFRDRCCCYTKRGIGRLQRCSQAAAHGTFSNYACQMRRLLFFLNLTHSDITGIANVVICSMYRLGTRTAHKSLRKRTRTFRAMRTRTVYCNCPRWRGQFNMSSWGQVKNKYKYKQVQIKNTGINYKDNQQRELGTMADLFRPACALVLSITYHAAPTTEREIARPIPMLAQRYGDVLPRNLQCWKTQLIPHDKIVKICFLHARGVGSPAKSTLRWTQADTVSCIWT